MASFANRETFRANLDSKRVHMDTGEKIPKSHPFLEGALKTKSGAYTKLKGGSKKFPVMDVKGKKGSAVKKIKTKMLDKITKLTEKKALKTKLRKKRAA